MKIALGAAQFGNSYGIANLVGQVKQSEVSDILKYASTMGIDTIDTAIAYGESEQCLGKTGINNWNIISKLPEIPPNYGDLAEWVRGQIKESLARLKINSLSGLLLHRPHQLLDPDKINLWSELLSLKSEGLVKKIGFSIYTPNELDELWTSFKPDLVQAPYSIFDRSLETSGWLQTMFNQGVEVHVRSIFLQGLLLMKKEARPKKFLRWSDLWSKWDSWIELSGLTPLEASVAFALSEKRISRIIIGTDSLRQLKEILDTIPTYIEEYPKNLCSCDPDLINPSNWSSL